MIQNPSHSQYKMYRNTTSLCQKAVKYNSRRDDGREIIMENQAVKRPTTRKSEATKNGHKKPIWWFRFLKSLQETVKNGHKKPIWWFRFLKSLQAIAKNGHKKPIWWFRFLKSLQAIVKNVYVTVLDSIRFLKSFQAIPFVKNDGSLRSRQNSKKHSKTPWQIVQNGCTIFSVTAKNSNEEWSPEIYLEMQSSRILRGFFCACNMRLRSHSAMIMVDSAGESKDSPLVSRSGNSKPASVCLPLSGVEGGSLKKPRGDCKMSIKSHSGNPPDKPDKIPLSWRSLATISVRFPIALTHKFALSALFRRFISVNVPVSASFVNA